MTKTTNYFFQAALTCLLLALTACGTTGTGTTPNTASTPVATTIESALPLVRTGAAVATGAVLDFAVKQSSTRTRLANEMYAAANAVYSLSGGTFPTPAQFQSGIVAFGGTQADANYAQFSTGIAALYAAYYPKLATGDTKSATDLLNAIAGGIEDATAAYMTTPSTVAGTQAVAPASPLPLYVVVSERGWGFPACPGLFVARVGPLLQDNRERGFGARPKDRFLSLRRAYATRATSSPGRLKPVLATFWGTPAGAV